MRVAISTVLSLLVAASAAAHPSPPQHASTQTGMVANAARPAASVVDAFHAALGRSDTKTALALLQDDVLIFESGGVERNKAEYASHHLAADAAFSQAVPATLIRRTGHVVGNTAWIASEGRTTGTYKGKAVDQLTTETMVLRRNGAGWKIAHIHWSSTAARKKN